ncbi:CHAT domain-containing protein [Trichoderma camerunense]
MPLLIKEFHIDAELLSSLHEASEEDLRALAELHEDPSNDDQIELYIYLCFLIFQNSRNTQSLEQAIQRAEGWAATTAASHPDHDRRHSILNTLVAWSHQSQVIEEDIGALLAPLESRESVTNELDLPIRLEREATRLVQSFQQTGRFECLNEAIETIELAISKAGEYTTTVMLRNLGVMLRMRSEQTGSTDDLNQATSILRDAVDAMPHDDPNRALSLSYLGVSVLSRFKHKGSMEDLNQAISILSEAVDAIPHDHRNRAICLNNLVAGLNKRSQVIGSIDDIDRAVDAAREAFNIAPHDSPQRASLLSNYGSTLSERFKRAGSIDDLDQAISMLKEAVDAMPHGHPDRACYLGNLGGLFIWRSNETGLVNDLNQAISMLKEAVDAIPYNHPNRAFYLECLGTSLQFRFRLTQSIDDYNQAMSVVNEALDTRRLDDPGRAIFTGVAASLQALSGRAQSEDDLDRLIPMLVSGWRSEFAPAYRRIITARLAALHMMERGDWEQSYQLLREAILLLHTVSPRFSNRTDTQNFMRDTRGLASSATAAALNAGKAPEDALRLLEHGRGIIASLLLDMRGDITDLLQQYPDLAEKFILLRDELDLPGASVTSPTPKDNFVSQELKISRHREANREFKEVIDAIRAQLGFSNFLQPPDVKELMGAAEQGPIIVLNQNQFRSDAFLIQTDSIQVIKLPGLDPDEVRRADPRLKGSSDLSPFLEWLWHTICHPCLNALGIKDAVSDDNWPHIWWISTGLLGGLPLHAAGIYKQGSKETVLDRVISSYASSIKALLHGRKHGIQKPRQRSKKTMLDRAASSYASSNKARLYGRKHRIQKPRQLPLEDSALIVSMQETPGLGGRGRLPFAADEVQMLRHICPQLRLKSITPSRNKEDVLKHMPKCKIFHFAGHGQSDPRDPSQSCLLLKDWETNPLTVGDIRDSRLQDDPPFLAYLSACSTGVNKVEQLADEGIHLISAFQLAGFRHAIGTLWEVSDKHCVDVARILYKTLQEEGMTDLAVSRGLHRAVRALRDGNADDVLTRDAKLVRPRPASQGMTDFLWTPYVHFGV